MNHNCHGDFFSINGAQQYRCSYNGSVISGIENGNSCPICDRVVDGAHHGALVVVTELKRYVMLPGGRNAILSITKNSELHSANGAANL